MCTEIVELHRSARFCCSLRVIFEVIFCVESESELRIGLSRQDFEIFEVMYIKNGFFDYF